LLKARTFLRIRKEKILELCVVIQEEPVRKTIETVYTINEDTETFNQISKELNLTITEPQKKPQRPKTNIGIKQPLPIH